MAARLATLDGEAVVSPNDHPGIRRSFAGFQMEDLEIEYTGRVARRLPPASSAGRSIALKGTTMNNLTRYGLTLTVDGASIEDLERGLNAARQLLEMAGARARDAWGATVEIEEHGLERLYGEHGSQLGAQEKAALWLLAFDAAVSACCRDEVPPRGADLSLAS